MLSLVELFFSVTTLCACVSLPEGNPTKQMKLRADLVELTEALRHKPHTNTLL